MLPVSDFLIEIEASLNLICYAEVVKIKKSTEMRNVMYSQSCYTTTDNSEVSNVASEEEKPKLILSKLTK